MCLYAQISKGETGSEAKSDVSKPEVSANDEPEGESGKCGCLLPVPDQ